MKKALILPFFAVTVLVSQVMAQEHCKEGGQLAFCQWATGCYTVNNEYDNVGVPCPDLITACKNGGKLYTGASVPPKIAASPYGKDANCADEGLTAAAGGNESCGFYCKWETGCKEIKTDINGVDNPQPIPTCTAAIAACDKDAQRYDNSSCTGTPVGGNPGGGGSLGYCDWGPCVAEPGNPYGCLEGGCFEIKDEVQLADCQSGKTVLTSQSECPASSLPGGGNPTPIHKFTPASTSLIVAPFGRSLHISSVKDATVSLYDMNGAKVYSGKVSAGNRVFSLEKVSSGSYYAIVQSGSDSKKVPVILK